VQLLQVVGRTDRTKFRNLLIRPLLQSGLLQLTVPEKPQSRMQRYRLTPAGEAALRETSNE
jgi:ATP-dependent DNA helicase RecG